MWEGSGYGEHARVDVKANHMSRSHPFCRKTGHDAGTASNVEHSIASLWGSARNQIGRPERGDRRDQIPLVKLGGISLQLPGFVRDHGMSSLAPDARSGGGAEGLSSNNLALASESRWSKIGCER
jgi:hypothetical protein